MSFKKSLVLLGVKNEDEKAVLSFEQEGDMIAGRVRLYNFPNEPSGILSLGIYSKGKVQKAGLSRASSMLYKFKVESLPENFSCAVVNFYKADVKPILYGSTEGNEDKEAQVGKVMASAFEEYHSADEVKDMLDKNSIDYTDEYKKELEREIDKEMQKSQDNCCDCANCKYKKAFYERLECQENSIKSCNVEEKKEEKTFFDEIKGQILPLFEKNAREEFLEDIIPNSKWIKIDYEEEGDYYILGLIYEEGKIKYLVYGVPGVYQKNPPNEISGYPVWFPLDKERKESFGYWLSYQDIDTGESVKAVVE